MSDVYDVGDRIKLQADFKNSAGTATNPTAVTLKTRDPNGVQGTRTAVQTGATGHYEFEMTLTGSDGVAGMWAYRWEATGTVITAEEGQFEVRKTKFT